MTEDAILEDIEDQDGEEQQDESSEETPTRPIVPLRTSVSGASPSVASSHPQSAEEGSSTGSMASSTATVEEDWVPKHNSECKKKFSNVASCVSKYVLFRKKGKTFIKGPSSWHFWKPEFFRIQVKDGEAWPVETQWRKVKTSKLNAERFTLTAIEERQVAYLERHSYKPKDLVEPARLVLYGLSPEPYKMKGIKKQKCSVGVCTPLTIFTEVEKDGEIIEVSKRVIVVSKGGYPHSCMPQQDPANPFEIRERLMRKIKLIVPPLLEKLILTVYCYRGDYNMNHACLAAAQKHLQDEMAAAAAGKSASKANVTSLTIGSTLPSIAEESNEANDLQVLPSPPTKRLLTGQSSQSVPSEASHLSLFTSGIFSGGGFGEWRELECQGQVSPPFVELLGRYFAHGLSFGTLHDVAAVRDLSDVERAAFIMASTSQAKLIATEGKLKTTELSLRDANRKAKKKDDLLRKLKRTHLKSVSKLQTKVNNLNAEVDACYLATTRQVLRARASAIYMIKKAKDIDDVSGINFEDEELSVGDPLSKEFDPKPFEAPPKDPDSSDEDGTVTGKEVEGGKEVSHETEDVEQHDSPLKKKRKTGEE
ncbi:hypothetical protein CCACVL1_06349 [Corchorus capsularis]|uniref:Uncharacterized protein n=1 Tax=Corchorus capsularis TaxID=210143 RepID=A0A1R3JG41_COCAP|nr:hypothetical protein CCACVL1_06349 [Corchorus capsularis]